MIQLTGQNGQSAKKIRGFGHLILAIATLSAVSVVIAVPRPTSPHILPLPSFDYELGQQTEAQQRARARDARQHPLPYTIRAVGEQVRRIGLKIYQRAPLDTLELKTLRLDVRAALDAKQVEELLNLRALQSQLFVDSVQASLRAQSPNLQLQELGGEFSHLLFSAWLTPQKNECKLGPELLPLMFRNHFNQLTGLARHPKFEFNLEEMRRYYGTLLEYPPIASSDPEGASQLQLMYAEALSRVDPSFEARPLLGILQLRLDRPGHAAQLFESFLTDRPNGPLSHLVRGHRKLALRLAAQRAIGLQ